MPSGTDLDDDYVARLLAEDAKKTSHKYAAQGLSAFGLKRRAADVPKPNTRFLSHIVREADHHNAVLKRKEEQESERRLRALRDNGEPPRKRQKADESDRTKRSRMLKDISAAVQPVSSGTHRSTAVGRLSHLSQDHSLKSKNEQRQSRRHHSRERHRSPDNSRQITRRRNSSSWSESEGRLERPTRHKPTVRKSSSGIDADADANADANARVRARQPRHSNAAPLNRSQLDGRADAVRQEGEEAVRKRGRGAHRARSGIDDRFAKSYDPSQDVSLDSDHDDDDEDWDLALEAMRDRAKWKQNQASRMREAGFDEKEVSKWNKGFLVDQSREGSPSSMKWSRKGEVREWDAGKARQ